MLAHFYYKIRIIVTMMLMMMMMMVTMMMMMRISDLATINSVRWY